VRNNKFDNKNDINLVSKAGIIMLFMIYQVTFIIHYHYIPKDGHAKNISKDKIIIISKNKDGI
jgi:hypothetical protein